MNTGQILIYENTVGDVKIDVRLQEETVWLSQQQMGALFGKNKRTISEHIRNIFNEGELDENMRVSKIGHPLFCFRGNYLYSLMIISQISFPFLGNEELNK
jgi:hypothetical protein